MTTLAELHLAIEAAQPAVHRLHVNGKRAQQLRAEAWRAAFEWRDGIPAGGRSEEYLAGMAMIREKLK